MPWTSPMFAAQARSFEQRRLTVIPFGPEDFPRESSPELEAPWITELRDWVDKEWARYLKEEKQRTCPHTRMSEPYEIEAHLFSGQNLLPVPAQCYECGWSKDA